MKKQKVVDRVTIRSGALGEELAAFSAAIIDALGAKNASTYVQIHDVDPNTRLAIAFRHTPDGESWVDGDTDLFDTGASNDAKVGMQISSAVVDVTRIDQMTLIPKLQERTNPTAQVQATVSVWIVLKPF